MAVRDALLCMLALTLILQPMGAARVLQGTAEPEFVPGVVLVQTADDPTSEDYAAQAAGGLATVLSDVTLGIQFAGKVNSQGWKRFKHQKGDSQSIVSQLRAKGMKAELDYILKGYDVPTDPQFPQLQQAMTLISMPDAWTMGAKGSKSIKICVIDSGVQFNHTDLTVNVDQSLSMDAIIDVDGVGAAWDDAGHGTHIAGVIGAVANNNVGIAGMAWDAHILACRFMVGTARGPQGTTSNAAKCIDWCRLQGANITSNSYGSPAASIALQDAVTAAEQAGMLFVAAAGNDATNIDSGALVYPAAYVNKNIITVGNSNMQDGFGTQTNWGATSVDLFAPGTGIFSTWLNGDYKLMTGTSMATPFVAGAAAVIWGNCPNMKLDQLKNVLLQGVDLVPALSGTCTSQGRLNVAKSLSLAWSVDPTCLTRPANFVPIPVPATAAAVTGPVPVTAPSGNDATTPVPPSTPQDDGGLAVAMGVVVDNTKAKQGEKPAAVGHTQEEIKIPQMEYQRRYKKGGNPRPPKPATPKLKRSGQGKAGRK